jgi:hypothetical protein
LGIRVTVLFIQKQYRRYQGPLLGRRVAHNKITLIFLGNKFPSFAKKKAATTLFDLESLVSPQERESRVDHRGPSPG